MSPEAAGAGVEGAGASVAPATPLKDASPEAAGARVEGAGASVHAGTPVKGASPEAGLSCLRLLQTPKRTAETPLKEHAEEKATLSIELP